MSAEMPKMPEPLAMVAQFMGEWRETVNATAQPVYTAEQLRAYGQESARQAMERLQLPRSYGGSTFASWGDQQEGCTVRIHFTNTSEAQAWFSRLTDRWDAIRALIPQDPDHLAGVGNMVDGKDQSEKRHG